jgi:hypothetical protein
MIAKANASMIVGARQHVKWPVGYRVTRYTSNVVNRHHTPLNNLDKMKLFKIATCPKTTSRSQETVRWRPNGHAS